MNWVVATLLTTEFPNFALAHAQPFNVGLTSYVKLTGLNLYM